MKKVFLLSMICLLVSGCSSEEVNNDTNLDLSKEPSNSVICYTDDSYVYSKSVVEYNDDNVAISETYLTVVDYVEFGEDYYNIAIESYNSEVEVFGNYDGVDIQILTNDLEITVMYVIDLTVVSEEVIDYIGFDYEDYQISSDDLINKYEEYGATCVKN